VFSACIGGLISIPGISVPVAINGTSGLVPSSALVAFIHVLIAIISLVAIIQVLIANRL
jgi:hypothetical protein